MSDADDASPLDVPPGPRYVSGAIYRLERALDVEPDNPARPVADHPTAGERPTLDDVGDPEQLQALIEQETERDDPDRRWIGRVNERLAEVRNGD